MRTIPFMIVAVVLGCPTVASAGSHLQSSYLQGSHLQGSHLQGSHLQGSHLQSISLGSLKISSDTMTQVQVAGSSLQGYRWNTANGYWEYRYPNRYIKYVNGVWSSPIYTSMAGMNLTGTLSNGMTVNLNVLGVKVDCATAPCLSYTEQNTLSNPSYRSNSDVYLFKLSVQTDEGWKNLCGTENPYGFFMDGTWNGDGVWSTAGTSFVCNSGVISKCARIWGYKPWRSYVDQDGRTHSTTDLKQFHQTCVHAARAAYCEDHTSFTQDGTWVDIHDNFGFNKKLPETAANGMFSYESKFSDYGVTLTQTRYDDLQASGTIYEGNQVDMCFPEQMVVHYECLEVNGECLNDPDRGTTSSQRATDFSNDHRELTVSTQSYCPVTEIDEAPGTGEHTLCQTGRRLRWDCNACTQEVFTHDTYCSTNSWDAMCVYEASLYCAAVQRCSDQDPD